MLNSTLRLLYCVKILFLVSACTLPGAQQSSERQQYLRGLENEGLGISALVAQWRDAADRALAEAISIETPLQEEFWVEAAAPAALGYSLTLAENQFLEVELRSLPYDALDGVPQSLVDPLDGSVKQSSGRVFVDLYRPGELDSPYATLTTAETDKGAGRLWEVDEDGDYLLLVQPELLAAGRFQLTISVRSELAFPVSDHDNRSIHSFFGAARDGGKRQHHGVDIFASRGTPVLAVSSGTVARTGESRLGGLHVWQRSSTLGRRYYYAHLDDVAVAAGDVLNAGDLIGHVGNTGNAISTPPHLHFGVYSTFSGPVDPLPLISTRRKPDVDTIQQNGQTASQKPPPVLIVAAELLNVRSGPSTTFTKVDQLGEGKLVRVVAVSGDWLRIRAMDGTNGYVAAKYLAPPG